MALIKKQHFNTRVIHGGLTPAKWEGAAHAHPTAENLSQIFADRTTDHSYMRLTNQTNRILEQKLAAVSIPLS